MTGEVVCPSCGRGNERDVVERYRVCVHCGSDLGPALAGGHGAPDVGGERRAGSDQRPPEGQPYGGQPYPPPPGPFYGGPGPLPPYPPTYHPGVYDRPQREPYVDVGNLFRLLLHPKEAFEDLADHTSSSQGVFLALAFILVGSMVSVVMMFAIVGSLEVPDDATTVPGYESSSATQAAINLIVDIALFFVTAYLVFALLKTRGRHPSMERTIGMMGYAKFPMFIIGLVIALTMPFFVASMDVSGLEDEDPDAAWQALRSVCGSLVLLFGLLFVGFVWGLWVHSHAQSVANDVPLSTAAGYVLVSWIVVGAISFAIGLIVTAFVIGSSL